MRKKCHEMLTFELVEFDIGYNCILGRSFLIKFMAVIHSTYDLMKLLGPKWVISIPSDQKDVLACDVGSLAIVGHFENETSTLIAAIVQHTSKPHPSVKDRTRQGPHYCDVPALNKDSCPNQDHYGVSLLN
jgi:hypothetical protein